MCLRQPHGEAPDFKLLPPPVSLRRSTHLAPNDKADLTLNIRRKRHTGDNPHVYDPEWDFMDKMEFLDPWNLEEDPWAIVKIKSHRFHP